MHVNKHADFGGGSEDLCELNPFTVLECRFH